VFDNNKCYAKELEYNEVTRSKTGSSNMILYMALKEILYEAEDGRMSSVIMSAGAKQGAVLWESDSAVQSLISVWGGGV
jgi:hypothetical protein